MVLEDIISRKAKILEFSKPDPENMLDIEESEKIAIDTKLILKYNQTIENEFARGSLISEASYPYENALKIDYKGKEVVLGYYAEENSIEDSLEEIENVTFLMNISTLKRLYIKTCDEQFEELQYDKCFINYENKLDEYDAQNDEKFGEYLSDRLESWKNKEGLNLEKYQLSDSEKEFLVDMLYRYNIKFDLAFKDGILSLSLRYCYDDILNQYINQGRCDLLDGAFEILERFMYI